jgi:hypothetical protein
MKVFFSGTTSGGKDIQPFTDVGLTNHKTFHDLKLQNGHTYFASVIGNNFLICCFLFQTCVSYFKIKAP